MTSVGIIGASGFTGAELLRLCAQHPQFDVKLATGDTQAGAPVADLYPSLAGAYGDMAFDSYESADQVDGLDLVFLALPHGASQAVAPDLLGRVGGIVDLAADFRLTDPSLYPTWYGSPHTRPDLLGRFAFGLPELFRADIAAADAVAAPGCYVTAATLALAPLLRAGLVEPTGIVVDAASGASGAGRGPKPTSTFCTIDEDFTAYGLLTHRHTPEIEQALTATLPTHPTPLTPTTAAPAGTTITAATAATIGMGAPIANAAPIGMGATGDPPPSAGAATPSTTITTATAGAGALAGTVGVGAPAGAGAAARAGTGATASTAGIGATADPPPSAGTAAMANAAATAGAAGASGIGAIAGPPQSAGAGVLTGLGPGAGRPADVGAVGSGGRVQVLFTPHMAPMNRGILATCYVRPTQPVTTGQLLEVLNEAWRDEPFVVAGERSPSTKATLGSNAVHVTARADQRTGWVVAIAALDNLVKGASGQAVQCANILAGLPETTGLPTIGLYP